MDKNLTKRTWISIVLFSLMGGIAWNIENMYFNTFLFGSIYEGTIIDGVMEPYTAIEKMVSLSAITAVVTTFIMGALSEKMKKRKVFISVGYILWGIVTALFGFISKENIASALNLTDETQILTATVWAVIVMDMIMTFMGSTSNDSAFNAWITDVTNTSVRPKVETALTLVGFVAMAIVMVVGSSAQATNSYQWFFIGLGLVVTVCGIVGLFLLKDPEIKGEKTNSSYWSDLFYGFRPSVIKENINLYLALSCVGFYSIAVQVFFPFLLIYLEKAVIAKNQDVNLLSAPIIILAVVAVVVLLAGTVILLKVAAKNKIHSLLPAVICFVVGLLVLSTSTSIYAVLIGIAPTLIGYLVLMIQLNASVRDFIPEDKVGLFQGIRMIFAVLLPMVIGPKLGAIACRNSVLTYEEFGQIKTIPSPSMFLYAAVVSALIIIPLFALIKKGVFKKSNETK